MSKRLLPCRLIWLAFLTLWIERAWPALCPAVIGTCLFLAAAVTGLFELLPGLWHLFVLVSGGLALGWLYYIGIRALSVPSRLQLVRRIERDSILEHRPLTSVDDRLALGESDPISSVLWEEHRRRLQGGSATLRVGPPLLIMRWRDPLRLRFVSPFILILALGFAWHDTPERLLAALSPDLSSLRPPMPSVQVWLTPPPYTKRPVVLLENVPPAEGDNIAPVTVPAGSTILALVQGGWNTPSLIAGNSVILFEKQNETDWRLEDSVLTAPSLRVEQDGRTVGEWPVILRVDRPPTIVMTQPPVTDSRGRFKVSFEAKDDYGIEKIEASVRLAASPDEKPVTVSLSVPPNRPDAMKSASWIDLASHHWVGQLVTVRLTAWDEAGQEAFSESQSLILPERTFTDSAALKVIAQRKALMKDLENANKIVLQTLRIYARSEDIHRNRPTISLALAVASSRLLHDRSGEGLDSVLSLLWDTAVALEDGFLGDTARTLEQARRNLEDALAATMSDEEILVRIDRLEQALTNHLRTMMQTMQQQGVNPDDALVSGTEGTDSINMSELGETLQQMRSLSQMGAREAAQEALSRMNDMLESLQNARPAPPMSAEERDARQAMQEMKDIISRQRALIDETFAVNRQQMPLTLEQTRNLRDKQSTIRQALKSILKRLENGFIQQVPENFFQAEGSMQDVEKNLRQGNVREAQSLEEEALELLEKGVQEGQQRIARASGKRLRLMFGAGTGGSYGKSRDPLGRPMKASDDGSTHVPSQSDVQKARQILEELRGRAGDFNRPEDERGYLNRLLKRF